LENHPVLWRSKLLYILPAGLLLWGVFFAIGYFTTNLQVLKTTYNGNRYFDTYSVVLHIILALIVLSIWALNFYKKNAIRHYYPLGRFYFTKLYLFIAIGFFPIISLYIPFQAGVGYSSRSIVSIEALREDAKTYNLASVFLGDNVMQQEYDLINRAYPAPFPMTILEKKYPISDFEHYPELVYSDSSDKQHYYYPTEHPENSFKLNDLEYQFLKTHQAPVNPYCYTDPKQYILEFYHPDTTVNWKSYSLLNYSKVSVRSAFEPEFHPGDINEYYYFDYSESFRDEQREFARYYAPTINRWVTGEKLDSIRYILASFQQILNKYAIPNKFDPKELAKSALMAEKNPNPDFKTVETSFSPSHLALLRSHAGKETKGILLHEIPRGYEKDELNRLMNNMEIAYYPDFQTESFLVSLMVAFLLAMALLLFDFTPFIEFLISIPVMGVLMIIVGFIGALIDINSGGYYLRKDYPSETYVSLLIAIADAILVLFSVIAIYGKTFNKRVAGIFLNVGYFAAPLLPIVILITIVQFSRKWVYMCDNWNLALPKWAEIDEVNTIIILFISGLAGLLLYFRLIKIWYAKKD
jgi:hypothetical protein